MQERLQKIIARAGIASRRHAEQLIVSGQVRVNGKTVRELGTKADPASDRIEAAGKMVTQPERRVYILMNKPPEVVATLTDPEGRRTLRNCLRGLPERVYPVGNLEYAASGAILLTNDGDLAAELLKHWEHIEQTYHLKVKGMLTREELARLGKEAGVRMETLRQPSSSRGHAANFWYEMKMRGTKKEPLRHTMFRTGHPIEKWIRVSVGPLSIEGIPRGRYRELSAEEAEALRKAGHPAARPTPSRLRAAAKKK